VLHVDGSQRQLFTICSLHEIILEWSNQPVRNWRDTTVYELLILWLNVSTHKCSKCRGLSVTQLVCSNTNQLWSSSLCNFLHYFCCVGWNNVSVELLPLTGPLFIPQMIHEWIWSSGGMILTGENRRTRRKTCPSATLSTTNYTWTDLVGNPGLRREKPATNRLSYDTANFLHTPAAFPPDRVRGFFFQSLGPTQPPVQ
jgi:hypothetical protein